MAVARFLENVTYKDEGVAVTVLSDDVLTKEIRIAFKKGQVMEAHQAPYAISVMTIVGSIKFGVHGKMETLNAGDVINLEASVVHSLEATEDSVVRLTLNKADTIQRVSLVPTH